jgi:hypothetical protein
MAVNNYGDLFFSNSSLFRCAADQTSNITLESNNLNNINDIHYRQKKLYFVAEDQNRS